MGWYPGDRPANGTRTAVILFWEEITEETSGKRGTEQGNSRGEIIDEEDRLFKCSSVGR